MLKSETVAEFRAKPGASKGENELGFGAGGEMVGNLAVVAEHEDAAGEVLAGGGDVDPADGVLDILVLGGEGEELVDAVELDAFVVDEAADDGLELELDPGEDAGEAEAADGGGEPVGIVSGRAVEALAVGADELKLGDVGAEGAGEVVIFAVDVVGNGAAEGDVFRSRGDGEEPAVRDGEVEELGEREAGFGGEDSLLLVKAEQAVHAGGDEEVAALEEAGVAVAAAHADGECTGGHAVVVLQDPGVVGLPGERDECAVVERVASPGFKGDWAFELVVDVVPGRGGPVLEYRRVGGGRHCYQNSW